jgi:hypothetical protein
LYNDQLVLFVGFSLVVDVVAAGLLAAGLVAAGLVAAGLVAAGLVAAGLVAETLLSLFPEEIYLIFLLFLFFEPYILFP